MKVLERTHDFNAGLTCAPARSGKPVRVVAEALSSLVRPGELVYVPGASGAPLPFVSSLLAHREYQKDLPGVTN